MHRVASSIWYIFCVWVPEILCSSLLPCCFQGSKGSGCLLALVRSALPKRHLPAWRKHRLALHTLESNSLGWPQNHSNFSASKLLFGCCLDLNVCGDNVKAWCQESVRYGEHRSKSSRLFQNNKYKWQPRGRCRTPWSSFAKEIRFLIQAAVDSSCNESFPFATKTLLRCICILWKLLLASLHDLSLNLTMLKMQQMDCLMTVKLLWTEFFAYLLPTSSNLSLSTEIWSLRILQSRDGILASLSCLFLHRGLNLWVIDPRSGFLCAPKSLDPRTLKAFLMGLGSIFHAFLDKWQLSFHIIGDLVGRHCPSKLQALQDVASCKLGRCFKLEQTAIHAHIVSVSFGVSQVPSPWKTSAWKQELLLEFYPKHSTLKSLNQNARPKAKRVHCSLRITLFIKHSGFFAKKEENILKEITQIQPMFLQLPSPAIAPTSWVWALQQSNRMNMNELGTSLKNCPSSPWMCLHILLPSFCFRCLAPQQTQRSQAEERTSTRPVVFLVLPAGKPAPGASTWNKNASMKSPCSSCYLLPHKTLKKRILQNTCKFGIKCLARMASSYSVVSLRLQTVRFPICSATLLRSTSLLPYLSLKRLIAWKLAQREAWAKLTGGHARM